MIEKYEFIICDVCKGRHHKSDSMEKITYLKKWQDGWTDKSIDVCSACYRGKKFPKFLLQKWRQFLGQQAEK